MVPKHPHHPCTRDALLTSLVTHPSLCHPTGPSGTAQLWHPLAWTLRAAARPQGSCGTGWYPSKLGAEAEQDQDHGRDQGGGRRAAEC